MYVELFVFFYVLMWLQQDYCLICVDIVLDLQMFLVKCFQGSEQVFQLFVYQIELFFIELCFEFK